MRFVVIKVCFIDSKDKGSEINVSLNEQIQELAGS